MTKLCDLITDENCFLLCRFILSVVSRCPRKGLVRALKSMLQASNALAELKALVEGLSGYGAKNTII